MSQKNKYSAITKQDIEKGLKDGIFYEEDKKIIRHKNGEIVKFLENEEDKKQSFPSTLFQFNTMNVNQTIIYQTDIQPYIDALIKNKNIELVENLNILYSKIIDSLAHYKSYDDRLEDLNKLTLESLSEFESFLKNIHEENITERELTTIHSYIDILFIYMISTYKLYEKKICSDTIVYDKIKNLYVLVYKSYEALLASNDWNNNVTFHNSLYAYFLLEDKNDGIKKIEKYIKYDNRFESFIDFMEKIQQNINRQYNTYNINIQSETIYNQNNEKTVEELFHIIKKIFSFRKIYEELKKVGNIDSKEIKSYITDESFKLLAIN